MTESLSTPQQRKIIGYFRKLLKMPEDVYREMLWTWHTESAKDLTEDEAEILIRQLKRNAISAGVFQSKKKYSFQRYRYNNLDGRDSKMATALQLRKIEVMWFNVSRQLDDIARASALNKFCERITGKKRMQFLTKTDASKLIVTLEKMQENKRGKEQCQQAM